MYLRKFEPMFSSYIYYFSTSFHFQTKKDELKVHFWLFYIIAQKMVNVIEMLI